MDIDNVPVLRCKSCQLNQFVTKSGLCRRCHKPLFVEEPVVCEKKEEIAQPLTPPSGRATPIDMGRAIWLLRSVRGLSQRAMAQRMGTARTYISKLETNRCMPTTTQIRRLAGTLEVSEYCLITLATIHNQVSGSALTQ